MATLGLLPVLAGFWIALHVTSCTAERTPACAGSVEFKVHGQTWTWQQVLDQHKGPFNSTWKLASNEHFVAVEANAKQACGPFPKGRISVQLRHRTSDVEVFKEVWMRHEFQFLEKVLEDIGPIKRVMDLGGNCGMATLYFSTRWKDAQIVTVEPGLGNFNMITLNLASKRKNVFLERAAIGPNDGFALFLDRGLGHWGYGTSEMHAKAKDPAWQQGYHKKALPMVTMHTLLSKYRWDSIDYLKIDVEGAELQLCKELLRGAWWGQVVRCASVETHDRFGGELSNSTAVCKQAFLQAGFTFKGHFGELDMYCK